MIWSSSAGDHFATRFAVLLKNRGYVGFCIKLRAPAIVNQCTWIVRVFEFRSSNERGILRLINRWSLTQRVENRSDHWLKALACNVKKLTKPSVCPPFHKQLRFITR